MRDYREHEGAAALRHFHRRVAGALRFSKRSVKISLARVGELEAATVDQPVLGESELGEVGHRRWRLVPLKGRKGEIGQEHHARRPRWKRNRCEPMKPCERLTAGGDVQPGNSQQLSLELDLQLWIQSRLSAWLLSEQF